MGRWRGGYDDDDGHEKIGKIRKRQKKTPKSADLQEEFEKPEDSWSSLIKEGYFAARVVEVHKRYVFVSAEKSFGKVKTNDVWLAEVARKFRVAERAERNFVAVGDRVLCMPAEMSENNLSPDPSPIDLPRCVIQNMAPRRSRIARLDPHNSKLVHVLATNMDQVLIVSSYLHPTVKWGLIDRYLVLAESEQISAAIVLNKRDLLYKEQGSEFYKNCIEMENTYKKIGYPVFSLQIDGEGAEKNDPQIAQIEKILKKKTTLISGHSGVGKSSLANLFDPEIIQPVEENSDIFYKGRHTTTYASFIKLGTGGYIIDTPGIRSFTFPEYEALELSACFVEFRPHLGQCKYRECQHIEEPQCAIKVAVEQGSISEYRYKSYQAILLGASGREGRTRNLVTLEI